MDKEVAIRETVEKIKRGLNVEEKKNPQISIIMPCYNAERFIEESMQSVFDSTIAEKCELIVINDGSTDNTEEIVKKKAVGITKPQLLYKKINNSGVSVARNTGLDLASGEFVVFLDSDDKHSPAMLKMLLQGVTEFHSDMGFCQWTDKEEHVERNEIEPHETNLELFLRALLYRSKPIGLWSVIFKKSLLDQNEIRFSSNIKYGEDLELLWRAALKCSKVTEVDAKYYYYRLSPTSAMKKATWRKTEILNVMEAIGATIKDLKPSFYKEFSRYMIPRTLLSLLKDFSQTDSRDNYIRLGKEYDCKRVMRLVNKGGLMIRMSALLYRFSPKLFYRIFNRIGRK